MPTGQIKTVNTPKTTTTHFCFLPKTNMVKVNEFWAKCKHCGTIHFYDL